MKKLAIAMMMGIAAIINEQRIQRASSTCC